MPPPLPKSFREIDNGLSNLGAPDPWSPAGGGGPGCQRTPGPGGILPFYDWLFGNVAGLCGPLVPAKLPAPASQDVSAEDAKKLANQGLPANVTVTNDKGGSPAQPAGQARPPAPSGDEAANPAGSDDDDMPKLGVDVSGGVNIVGSPPFSGQLSLVAKNVDLHRFLRHGKRFLDVGHEPSFNLSLSFDGIDPRDAQFAAQLAVSALDWHIVQDKDDILEAALGLTLTRDHTGYSLNPAVQSEWHLTDRLSLTLQVGVTVDRHQPDSSWKVHWDEVTVTPGILFHFRK